MTLKTNAHPAGKKSDRPFSQEPPLSLSLWQNRGDNLASVITPGKTFPSTEPIPLHSASWKAEDLFAGHPPRWQDARKAAIYEKVSLPGSPCRGTVGFRRWQVPDELPDIPVRPSGARIVTGPFHYSPPATGTIEWHMNFADPSIFAFYGGSLFAQDEIQVNEHPVLAALREALDAGEIPPRTTDPAGRATPCTITGAERCCVIDFEPGNDLPDGLYGCSFARTPVEAVLARARPIRPPTTSHILAMAAPSCGTGRYTSEQLHTILLGAYTGFRAAALESAWIDPASFRTVIHTGLWGCGAFGGNPLVMVALQCLAADLAGVHLIFHASPPKRAGEIRLGISLSLDIVYGSNGCVPTAIETLKEAGYHWEKSDGN